MTSPPTSCRPGRSADTACAYIDSPEVAGARVAHAALSGSAPEDLIYYVPMDADQLRTLQAPLKQKYREEPGTALVTLKAQGRIGSGISCNVSTGRALVAAGLHPATGGDGSLVCSGDMLLEALVACAGVTLNAVATAIGVSLSDATVEAEGDIDFRGTLGVSKEAPVGFQTIRLKFVLDTNEPPEKLETLLKLTERYCVVFQTLKRGQELSVSFQKKSHS